MPTKSVNIMASVPPAFLALLLAVGLLVAGGVYNNAVAPQRALVREAVVTPLEGGATATPSFRFELQSERPVVGSHYLLDPDAKKIVPLDGGAPFGLDAGDIAEAAADGDAFVWAERGSEVTIRFFDPAGGTNAPLAINESISPVPGTMKAGLGRVVWNFERPNGTLGLAGFERSERKVAVYAAGTGSNQSAAGALRTDVFFTTREDRSDLWLYNASLGRVQKLADGAGVGKISVGIFFAVWVNQTGSQVEYFDALDRVVRTIPPPQGVEPRWALADGLTVLIGGIKQGLIFSSPRVEFYDFGTGNLHLYDSIGVDFDAVVFFDYADQAVVSVEEHLAPRPLAPLTPIFLIAAAASTGAGLLFGVRSLFRVEE